MGKWVVLFGIGIISLTLSNMPQYTPTEGVAVTSQVVAFSLDTTGAKCDPPCRAKDQGFSALDTTTPGVKCDPPCRSKEPVDGVQSAFAVVAVASAPDMKLPSDKKPCDPPCRHIERVLDI